MLPTIRIEASPTPGAPAPHEWLWGGGELGDLIRSMDWSKASLGPRESWPQSLRTAVRLVTESKLAMVLLWGPELLLLYNDAYREMAGDRHPAALGKPLRVVWPELWHIVEPLLTAVTQRGESFCFEDKRFPIRRGETIVDAYFTIAYCPVRTEDGAIGGTLVTLQETTNRLASEARLRKSRGILTEGERLAHVGSFEFDAKTQNTVWSEGEFEIYGLNPEGPSPSYGELLKRYIYPEDAAKLHEVFSSALQNGTLFELTHRIVRPDGEVRWVHDRAQPHFDDVGKLVRFVGATVDITQARQAEEALRQSEERYRAIVENAEEGIWTIDGQACTTFVNKRMANMLGYTVEEMSGRLLFDFMTEADRIKASQLIERRRSGVQERHEFTFLRKDGSFVRTEIGASPIVDEDGQIQGALALVMDITQRGQMEAMVEADHRKNEFIAVLSHELRNPLAPIRSGLYVIEHAPAGSEPARRALKVIERQVAHMAHLVEDLLDVSRIARGRIELRLAPLNLVEVARRVVEDHRVSFAQRGVGLELFPAPMPLPVIGDETRLSQAISNLLGNALKFTPRGGRAWVSLEADAGGSQAKIRVGDTGRGISKELMRHLFEPFAQGDHTLDRSLGGLGLGLVLVKGLIELHGGSVAVESEGPGKGATFTLTLPLQATDAVKGAAPLSQAGALFKRVLIIEDNVDAAEVLGDALALLGHTVALAHDGPEGLAQAKIFHPDVVICDVGLPGMDGYAVAKALRSEPSLCHIRLIAHTGYASREAVARALEAGFDAQLAKPVDMSALEKVVGAERLPDEVK